jgi:hypothetical protein
LVTLEARLKRSTGDQREVAEQLGAQVRQAVEVLIQSLDRADRDRKRELLKDVPESVLYEAAVTVMMRLVFLSSAEERGLLGDPVCDERYAVSTLVSHAEGAAGEEGGERGNDAWARLLSMFRAVFGGRRHERMKISAHPGNLFDPDRFPFLEGRPRGASWRTHPISPLPIDNRTVCHLLRSLQSVATPGEIRRRSFGSLDIEQIGHVYEGLLDRTARRAAEPMVGLVGAKGIEAEIELSRLERLLRKGETELLKFLRQKTGRTLGSLRRSLHRPLTADDAKRLKVACGRSKRLFERVRPLSGLIRNDASDCPVIIRAGSLFVTAGTDRRSTGTHYTPASLTEPIVRYTLEPLVYDGPAAGNSPDEWRLRSARQLLDLKICDMACGSGAFLLQACRYLADRLLEAWEDAERQHPGLRGVLPYADASSGVPHEALIPKDPDARLIKARRIAAQRCLYGVDKHPLGVEMARLSLWLLTMSKDKPFTFLDHCVRSGDSLVGISGVEQLKRFSLQPNEAERDLDQRPFTERRIDDCLSAVRQLRKQIQEEPSDTPPDIERKQALLKNAEEQTRRLTCAADLHLAATWQAEAKRHGDHPGPESRFHWPLEFPEVFVGRSGFDAFLGNPPFINAIEGGVSTTYKAWLASRPHGLTGTADFAFHFLAQAHHLAQPQGAVGMLLPRPFLNAKAAAQLRLTLLSARPPSVLFSPEHSSVFAFANVKVIAVILCNRGGGRCTTWREGELRAVDIQSDNWWSAISSGGNASRVTTSDVRCVGDVFDVAASMTTENAYELKPILNDRADTDWPRLVTTGLIDPGKCLWGEVACRYLKSIYGHPVICPFGHLSADLKRRLVKAARPKILVAGVAGPGGGIEAFVDERGLTCGAVSTYTITHPADSIAALKGLCDFLNSAEVAALVFTELHASSMGSGLLTIKKAFLSNLGLPAAERLA